MADITIYTTPTCPYCKKTKEFFQEHDIDYEEFDVASDQEKAKEMIEKSGQRGVPVISVQEDDEEEIIIGFNKDKLSETLGIEA
ncbi:MAG: glutaredoxin domain-containing protein [Candidatus Nanohaloarchaea archaeon]|nr:glutaredoxin domain-containing protein [Candidatus Nanohaloarchaea archaeon]